MESHLLWELKSTSKHFQNKASNLKYNITQKYKHCHSFKGLSLKAGIGSEHWERGREKS